MYVLLVYKTSVLLMSQFHCLRSPYIHQLLELFYHRSGMSATCDAQM